MFFSQIPACPASIGSEISRPTSSSGGATPCPARVAVWWPVVPPLVQTPTARNGQTTQLGVHDLENFSKVLELKMVFWGLGFHLASKVMFI